MDDQPPAEDCPDCGVAPGQLHEDGCDVARCKNTGMQRLSQAGCTDEKRCRGILGQGALFPQCRTRWSGEWPGLAECRALGWYAYLKPGVGWQPCGPDHEGAVEDLNRLITEGARQNGALTWDPYCELFVLRED